MSKRSRSDIKELEYRMELERRRRARQDFEQLEKMKQKYSGCAGNRLHTRRDFLKAGIHLPIGTALITTPLASLLSSEASAQNEFCIAGQGGGTKFISLNVNYSRGCNWYGDFVAGPDPVNPTDRTGINNTRRLGRDATTFTQFDHLFGVPMYTAPGTRHHGMLTAFQDAGLDPKRYMNSVLVCTDSNDDTSNNPNLGAHIMAKMNGMREAYADILGSRANRAGGVDSTLAPGSLDNSLRVSVVGGNIESNEEFVNLGNVTEAGGGGYGFSKSLATNLLNIIKDITSHDLTVGFRFLDPAMKKFIECGTVAAASSLQAPARPYKLSNNVANPQAGEDVILTNLLNRPLTGTVNNTAQDLNQGDVRRYGNLLALALNDYAKHIAFEFGDHDDHTNNAGEIEQKAEAESMLIARCVIGAVQKTLADGIRRQGAIILTSDGSAAHNSAFSANGRSGNGADAGDFGACIMFLFDTGPDGLGRQPQTTKWNGGVAANGAQLGALRDNGVDSSFTGLVGNNSAHVPYILARIVSIWLTGDARLFKAATATSGSPITSMPDAEFDKYAAFAPAPAA